MDFTDALNAISEFDGLDAGIVDKMENMEQQVTWRMYYFPGGVTKRWVSGVGVDTDDIHYDGITGNRDLFAEYNPRYLDLYVEQSRNNGWYNHFVYSDGSNTYHATIMDVDATLRIGIINNQVCGMIAGLIFFDKLDLFIESYPDYDEDDLKYILSRHGSQDLYDNQLMWLIGKTKKQFLSSPDGWLATDGRYCFMGDIWTQYLSVKEEYEAYRDKLFEIISSKPCFQVCTNTVKGVIIGNATISQSATCVQKMAGAGCIQYTGTVYDNGAEVDEATVTQTIETSDSELESTTSPTTQSNVQSNTQSSTQSSNQSTASPIASQTTQSNTQSTDQSNTQSTTQSTTQSNTSPTNQSNTQSNMQSNDKSSTLPTQNLSKNTAKDEESQYEFSIFDCQLL